MEPNEPMPLIEPESPEPEGKEDPKDKDSDDEIDAALDGLALIGPGTNPEVPISTSHNSGEASKEKFERENQ